MLSRVRIVLGFWRFTAMTHNAVGSGDWSMVRYCIGTLLLILSDGASAPALADWEYTRWGMTPEQVAAASQGAVKVLPQAQRQRIEEAKLESGAEGSFTDGALRLHVAFSFDTDGKGLAVVGYNVVDPAQNDLLKDWLIRKYGQPETKGGLPVTGLTTWDWVKPDEIELNISSGERGFVLQSRSRRGPVEPT
jgi:hypothetical protein